MANEYLNMDATTTSEKVVRRAKALCQLPTNSLGLNFVASSDAAVLDELSDLLNEAVRDVLDDCPILCIKSVVLTAAAGSESTTLPADLRHSDILSLEWKDTGDVRPIGLRLIPANEVSRLPDSLRRSEARLDPPEYCYLAWGGASAVLTWIPRPALDRDFTMLYRQTPVVFTDADVGVESTNPSAPVVPVPDSMIELVVYRLAGFIMERNAGGGSKSAQFLEARYQQKLDKWADVLASSPAARIVSRMEFAGFPTWHLQSMQGHEVSSIDYNKYI